MAPVALTLGVDPVQFGIVMILNLTMGLLTPPVGTAMFVARSISGVGILRLSRALLPFLAIMLVVLLIVTFVPIVSTVFAS